MLTLAITMAFIAFTAVSVAVFWNYRQASPVFWYPLALTLMAVGTFPMVDLSQNSDFTYVMLFFVAIMSFITAAKITTLANGTELNLYLYKSKPVKADSASTKRFVVFIFVLSCVISVFYYYMVGYNVLILLLTGGLTEDYSTMRLATYSGDNYFAPGYVNQFKNVLLPITAIAVCAWIKESHTRKVFVLFSLGVSAFVLLMLAGTGQRAYVLFALVASIFGIVLFSLGRGVVLKKSHVLLSALPFVALFAVMTGGYDSSEDATQGTVVARIIERFTSIQQEGALVGFHHIFQLPTAWFSEWAQGFAGILPGHEGSTLSHEIHEVMYGTFRGTVPLSVVGSAYYNGGVIGVVLYFALLGVLYASLYNAFLLGERSLVRCMAYGALFFYLTVYVSDAPVVLVDNGVVTLAIFLVLLRLTRGSSPVEEVPPRPPFA